MERWTCSREETTLPSWTSSMMVRTWRVVTVAVGSEGERGHRKSQAQAPPPGSHTEGSPASPNSLQARRGRLLPSLVGCEVREEEYWVAKLQGGRRGICQCRGAGQEPGPMEKEQLGRTGARKERSQETREKSQLIPQESKGTGLGARQRTGDTPPEGPEALCG